MLERLLETPLPLQNMQSWLKKRHRIAYTVIAKMTKNNRAVTAPMVCIV